MRYSSYKYLKHLLPAIGILSFSLLNAQEKKDIVPNKSEVNKLLEGKTDWEQRHIYDSLSARYVNNDVKFSLDCSNKAVEIALMLGIDSTKGFAYSNRAKAYKTLGENKKAKADLEMAEVIFQKIHNRPWLTSVYLDRGNLSYLEGE